MSGNSTLSPVKPNVVMDVGVTGFFFSTALMAYTSDWDNIPSPMGRILVPGFDRLNALTDADLCAEMNAAAFVNPQALAVAQRRQTILNFYNGRGYIWATRPTYDAWKAAQPDFFAVLLAAVTANSAAI